MLTLYGYDSSRAFRVKWLLCELDIEFVHEPARPHSAEIRALNPLGQVPVLTDGDMVLTDSLAILHYLADRAERFTYPPGTPERAVLDARINFVLTEMEAAIWLMAKHGFVLPEAERHPNMRSVAEPDFARGEARFAKLMGNAKYIVGPDFTIADIVAGQTLNWAEMAKMPLHTETARTYLERLRSRAGFLKAKG
ncbi:MAG: glutathione S-transferase family protein [Pseudomonadota bacterium]